MSVRYPFRIRYSVVRILILHVNVIPGVQYILHVFIGSISTIESQHALPIRDFASIDKLYVHGLEKYIFFPHNLHLFSIAVVSFHHCLLLTHPCDSPDPWPIQNRLRQIPGSVYTVTTRPTLNLISGGKRTYSEFQPKGPKEQWVGGVLRMLDRS